MDYNFQETEQKWQETWLRNKTYKADIDPSKPKYYVLDMFPYPSGAGLHVGHPLGYIASDIYARYKRLKGFNVLHPMGFDAYGLPAEQYAIQTGQHPAVTTEKNIARYKEQLFKIGFSFDWDREVRTCDPAYYKWTQWTFIQLFKSWYNKETQRAEPIAKLAGIFATSGNQGVNAAMTENWYKNPDPEVFPGKSGWDGLFSAAEWIAFSERQQQEILMNYRLAYLADTPVNWCPELGTVLANDEVSEGFSIRGGHPVVRRTMKQWLLRITAYAERLLRGLDEIDWSDSIREVQKNWIGRSEGGSVKFMLAGSSSVNRGNGQEESLFIEVFTTRPDTIFGATFMVLAPEHDLVEKITTPECREKIDAYIDWTKKRSERERMAEVKKVSGEFTGAYALNPFTGQEIPVWIADYVLMGYGTGAIMAVPGHDSRDFAFARHFNLPILQVVNRPGDIPSDPATWEESYDSKEGTMINSGFINGMEVGAAISAVIREAERRDLGTGTVNYRLRDAIFSRQRYWGEPFPVYYRDGMPYVLDESALPLELPEVDAYLPTETGEPPLARAKNWKTKEGWPLECSTMPGFAGSSAYYLRYMDPRNDREYFSKEAVGYWQNVDLYIGGSEHATGHLIYARFWNKFLFDLGLSLKEEPFKKLINQGMIQGVSLLARVAYANNRGLVLPADLEGPEAFSGHENISLVSLHIPVEFADSKSHTLTKAGLEALKQTMTQFGNLEIASCKQFNDMITEAGLALHLAPGEKDKFRENAVLLRPEVEKMSKSKFNVVNPDDLIAKYGADTLRLYEMFLGPLEQSKPWDTNGIEGVFRFIRKFWRLFHDTANRFEVTLEAPSPEEFKVLHRTIKKVQEDIERFSFNTVVSTLMICVNELSDLNCRKKAVLEDLVILISPYAPHVAEELWQLLGHGESVSKAAFPVFNSQYLVENTFEYPVSFNGKLRFKLSLPLDLKAPEIEKAALAAPESAKWLQGNPPRKVIVVPGKIVNIVI